MNIEVADIGGSFGRQTRAYAEYRIFSSLARFTDHVRAATMSLTRDANGPGVACSVVVSLASGTPVRVTARGRHAYDAINRAVQRIGPELERHAEAALPSPGVMR